MRLIKEIRTLLGRVVSFFCPNKNLKRHIRKLFENYDFKEAKRCKNFKHQIISLGNNCMARTIPTVYGLKARKIYGEKTIITDQTYFGNIKDLVYLWNTNFEDFLEGLCFSKELNAWYAPKYKSHSPHEFQLTKEEFSKTIKKRIKNFYEMLNTDKYAIFLRFEAVKCSAQDVKLLADKVRESRNGKPYKLIIVNHNEHIEGFHDENTIIIDYPMTLSAKWQYELDTEEGKKFCAAFIEPIKKIIDNI